MRKVRATACFLLALRFVISSSAVGQEATDALVARLFARLGDPAEVGAARAEIVGLGVAAVPGLVSRFQPGEPNLAVLGDVLMDLAPVAGDAFFAIVERLGGYRGKEQSVCLTVLAELAPYRSKHGGVDYLEILRPLLEARMAGHDEAEDPDEVECRQRAFQRLRPRMSIVPGSPVEDLIAIADGHHALRREAAVDLLARCGPAASNAVPALLRILQQPEPRILDSGRRVPLHSKAARALLAIAPDRPAVELAIARASRSESGREVDAPVPARLRQRLAELIGLLENDREGAAAVDNLVVLGEPAAAALGVALAEPRSTWFRGAALKVLAALGPKAAAAVPALFRGCGEWDCSLTSRVLDTLAASAPWCDDFLPASAVRDQVAALRVPQQLEASAAREVEQALQRFEEAMAMDPAAPLRELAVDLESRFARDRRLALVILRRRGAEARPLLPQLAAALVGRHPDEPGWLGEPPVHTTDELQRLAAMAILAIAAEGDPAVEPAREVLSRLPAGADGESLQRR